MNRQQLIEYLIDDITPRIKKSGDAHGELLKFANERNLSPALLESLGQLFNTAKTICYLDKSANRGGSFPIVDVPKLVNDYLEVPPSAEAKSAATPYNAWAFEAGPRDDKLIDMNPTGGVRNSFPTDLFANPSVVNEEADWMPVDECLETHGMASKRASTLAARHLKKSEIDKINQDIFDADQDCVAVLAKWAKQFRQDDRLRFDALESTVMCRYGDEAKHVLDKMAKYLSDNHIDATRATGPGTARLLDDRNGFLPDVGILMQKTASIAGWQTMLENAHDASLHLERELYHENGANEWEIFFKPAATMTAPPPAAASTQRSGSPRRQSNKGSQQRQPSTEQAGGGGSRNGGKGSTPDSVVNAESFAPDLGAEAKSLMDNSDGFFKSVLAPYKGALGVVKDVMGKGYNHDQAHIDSSAHDTKSQAMLQNLMLTDEVLSEADPEKVVSAYNTIRSAAPHISNDANAMRVYLRTALQHQGVDPFTLKGFSDAESARQKVEENQHKVDDREYSITGMGGKSNKPKRDGGEDKD